MQESPRSTELILLGSPASEIELLLIKSIFDEAGFPYFVKNDVFGSLAVGPQIDHYNRKSIWVHEDHVHEAQQLLAELRRKTGANRSSGAHPYSLGDKIRMALEFLLFGWIMPGRRPEKGPELRLIRGGLTDGGDRREQRDEPERLPFRIP